MPAACARQLADAGLEDRLFVGGVQVRVLQGHRQRAHVLQRALVARLQVKLDGDGKLQVGHAGDGAGDRAILSASARPRGGSAPEDAFEQALGAGALRLLPVAYFEKHGALEQAHYRPAARAPPPAA